MDIAAPPKGKQQCCNSIAVERGQLGNKDLER